MSSFPLDFVTSSSPMITLDNTYGAFFIGVVVAGALYGCIWAQALYYYTHYPSDPWYIKLLVAGVLVSETCHQGLLTHALYTYLVTQFGDLQGLEKVVINPIIAVVFGGFTTLFVQSFLTIRIYTLSKKNCLVTGLVTIMVIGQFVMVLVYAIRAASFHTFVQLASLRTLTMAMNATAAAADFFIALLLCFLLRSSRTGFRRSDTMIDRLIVFSISTGLFTSLCAIASLICISAWPHAFIYMTFYFSTDRLYSNALLVTFNLRRGLTGQSRNESISFCPESQRMTNRSKPGGTSSMHAPNNISINVDTTHEFIQDEQYSLSDDTKNPDVAWARRIASHYLSLESFV